MRHAFPYLFGLTQNVIPTRAGRHLHTFLVEDDICHHQLTRNVTGIVSVVLVLYHRVLSTTTTITTTTTTTLGQGGGIV